MPRYFHADAALEAKSMKLACAVTVTGSRWPSDDRVIEPRSAIEDVFDVFDKST
jgi:hypothetical protein